MLSSMPRADSEFRTVALGYVEHRNPEYQLAPQLKASYLGSVLLRFQVIAAHRSITL